MQTKIACRGEGWGGGWQSKRKNTSQGTQHRKLLLIKIIVELLETLNIREFFSFCS